MGEIDLLNHKSCSHVREILVFAIYNPLLIINSVTGIKSNERALNLAQLVWFVEHFSAQPVSTSILLPDLYVRKVATKNA